MRSKDASGLRTIVVVEGEEDTAAVAAAVEAAVTTATVVVAMAVAAMTVTGAGTMAVGAARGTGAVRERERDCTMVTLHACTQVCVCSLRRAFQGGEIPTA